MMPLSGLSKFPSRNGYFFDKLRSPRILDFDVPQGTRACRWVGFNLKPLCGLAFQKTISFLNWKLSFQNPHLLPDGSVDRR